MEVGDIVRLRSGGPEMTVTVVHPADGPNAGLVAVAYSRPADPYPLGFSFGASKKEEIARDVFNAKCLTVTNQVTPPPTAKQEEPK